LDLKGNPLSPHLQEAAGACFSNRDCEQAARRVMKFQRVYAEAHEKKRAKEAIKRQKEAEIEKQKKKEEKQAEKVRRRKLWEEEQLRKRMEDEIFGTIENNQETEESNDESNVQETERPKKSSNMRYYAIILVLLICLTLYVIN